MHIPAGEYSGPVEVERTPEGERQFEVTINRKGSSSRRIDTIRPMRAQANETHPNTFYYPIPPDEHNLKVRTYTFVAGDPDLGIPASLDIVDYVPADEISTRQPQQVQQQPPSPQQGGAPGSGLSQIQDGIYQVNAFPVHGDQVQQFNNYIYTLTLPGQPPIRVYSRLEDYKPKAPSMRDRAVGILTPQLPPALSMPRGLPPMNYATELKGGEHFRDWVVYYQGPNGYQPLYFQLKPTHRLKARTDGPWEVHVSRVPPDLIDKKEMGKGR